MSYITSLGGTGNGYFTDNNGLPILFLADNPWALPTNAGRWESTGGGTWQQDFDNYMAARSNQGFTALYTDPLGNQENQGVYMDGRTWDGLFPFTVNGTPASTAALTGSETIALNDPFWKRIDYMLASALAQGLTVFLNVGYTGGTQADFGTGGALTVMSSTQYTAWGAALAARYASTPNIVWAVGNDYFGGSTDSAFTEIRAGLQGGGDSHVMLIHNNVESSSRFGFGTDDNNSVFAWGTSYSQVNFVYTYIQTYFGIEYACAEASPIPVVWGDGYFYGGAGAANDTGMRQFFWWAMSSGARGANTGSEAIFTWASTSPAAVTAGLWYTQQAGVFSSVIQSLSGWQNLQPVPGSSFITAGRGTRCLETTSGGGGRQWGTATTDTYVTASITPDKTLALIYFSAGCGSSSITIDQTKLAAGYVATWIDPTNGAKYAGTAGTTYAPGTARGTNAAGAADWVLVLSTPPYATWTVP